MKVSIITSVFNGEKTIADTIESVLSQDYKNIEYIVIDGASTDNTCNIIELYKENIDIFITEPDNGIYDGLNKGIKLASGDIIGFLHSDDIYYDKYVISNVINEFKNREVDSVYGNLIYVTKNDTNKVVRLWKSGHYSKMKLKFGWMPPHPSLFIKKNVYDSFGCFDITLKISADYDSILRFSGKENISSSYLPKTLVKMRVGGKSNKSLNNLIQKSLEDYKALKKNNVGGVLSVLGKNISKIPQFLIKN